MARVAALMDSWAEAWGLGEGDRIRWRAAAHLHDALRDESPGSLRERAEAAPRLPDPMLHGPAAAARLRAEGVGDEPLLLAITWHTTGHPCLDELGRHLYLADYLEPGRPHTREWHSALRARMPAEAGSVVREVAADRIAQTLRSGHPLLAPTVDFWNGILDGR
jgi:HD superfamily phosphohydrolase YqeK